MFPEKSPQNLHPPTAVVAAWAQLAVAALIVVLVVVNTFGLQLMVGPPFPDSPLSPLLTGLPLALAGWLAVTAVGQLRGSRVAYRLSVAGLALPLLFGAAASLGGTSTTYVSSNVITARSGQEAAALADRLSIWAIVSTAVNGAASLAALALAVLTLGLLLTRPTRRFFAAPVRNER